jgi:hypothetical protein
VRDTLIQRSDYCRWYGRGIGEGVPRRPLEKPDGGPPRDLRNTKDILYIRRP